MISCRSAQACFLSAGVRSRYEGWKVGSSGVPRYSKNRPRSLPRESLRSQQGVGRVPAERADDLRADQRDLGAQVGEAGGDLVLQRVPVPGRTALEDVGDEDLARARDPSRRSSCRGAGRPPRRTGGRAGPRRRRAPRRRTSGGPSGRPSPGTVCVRVACSGHFVQVPTTSAISSSELQGRLVARRGRWQRPRRAVDDGAAGPGRRGSDRTGRPACGGAAAGAALPARRRFEPRPAALAHLAEQFARLPGDVGDLALRPARALTGRRAARARRPPRRGCVPRRGPSARAAPRCGGRRG